MILKSFWSNCQYDNDVIMGAIASQITSLTIVYSIVNSDADQRKHQSCDRWIPRTNGQLRGKCFHLMTSSCKILTRIIHLMNAVSQTHAELRENRFGSTHLSLDKMADISHMMSSEAFSSIKRFVFWFKFHWRLFLRVQLTIIYHWFR